MRRSAPRTSTVSLKTFRTFGDLFTREPGADGTTLFAESFPSDGTRLLGALDVLRDVEILVYPTYCA